GPGDPPASLAPGTLPGVTAMGETVPGSGVGSLVLVLNSGSSSVKFAVLAPASGERALAGVAEKVGTPGAELRLRRHPDHVATEQLPGRSYQALLSPTPPPPAPAPPGTARA